MPDCDASTCSVIGFVGSKYVSVVSSLMALLMSSNACWCSRVQRKIVFLVVSSHRGAVLVLRFGMKVLIYVAKPKNDCSC